MTDLREVVEDDRGLIKKIQLVIPGFRGYRQKEDVRLADSLLRMQIADELKNKVLANLEQTREVAGRALELDLMNDLAGTISQAKTAEARIRHAEQGYTGISPAYRVKKDNLDQLYEFDLDLVNGIRGIGDIAMKAYSSAQIGDFNSCASNLREVKAGLIEFSGVFDKRIETMANLGAI
ncbi:MAG: hypothetical protein Q4Q53_08505 [Methanocorpusculum sp.]|nr:hypothetical protein [Methanocorpusculum sp.]